MKLYSLFLVLPMTAVVAISASSAPTVQHAHKKNSPQTKHSTSSITSTQKNAIQSALKSLRRLGAATEVGVSQTDYQSRLIDTKADVDEDLRAIPGQSPVAVHIKKCLEAYQDASDAWNDNENFHFWSTFKDFPLPAPKVVKKYKIATQFEDENAQAASRDELAEYAHGVITKACWKVAHSECDKAEANLR
jgi:hypothetical protein